MTTKISQTSRLKDIQKRFSKKFPYLKIEFYTRPYSDGELTLGKHQIDPETPVSEIALKRPASQIVFSDNEKVADLERKLREDFGLFAHIFRKSGHVWIQTTSTNHWTLQHQNEHAQEGAKYKPMIDRTEEIGDEVE